MKTLSVEYNCKPIVERLSKWQIRPLNGWLNGVDPYPVLSDEDIAMETVHRIERTGVIEAVGVGAIQLGQVLDLFGAKFTVTEFDLISNGRTILKGEFDSEPTF